MYGENVMNTIADGIYQVGYESDYSNNLVNEDGNKNQTYEDVAWWLDISLKNDIKAGKLNNPNVKEVVGETGTALDQIVAYIYQDEGALRNVLPWERISRRRVATETGPNWRIGTKTFWVWKADSKTEQGGLAKVGLALNYSPYQEGRVQKNHLETEG